MDETYHEYNLPAIHVSLVHHRHLIRCTKENTEDACDDSRNKNNKTQHVPAL